MPVGTVKWFNSRKGYGFITTPDGDKDVFVHYTAINVAPGEFASLYENDEVEFDIEQGQKGLEARNVSVTKRAPRPPRNNYYSY